MKTIYEELLELKKTVISNLEIETDNKSLRNLAAYLNLRSQNVTKLQNELTNLGLSSLGRAQSCIINSINQELAIVSKLLKKELHYSKIDEDALSFEESKLIHLKNSEVFGRSKDTYTTKIMVTLPSLDENSPKLIQSLIKNGATVLRINTAHDDVNAWQTMAKLIKEENKQQQKDTKIYVDLAGPKNRTEYIQKLFTPFKIGSWRNPKLVEIISNDIEGNFTTKGEKDCSGNNQSKLAVEKDFFESLKNYDELTVDDFERETTQTYKVIIKDDRVFIEVNKKITIYENSALYLENEDNDMMSRVTNFELKPQNIRVFKTNKIIITSKNIIGQADFIYEDILYAGIIGCTNKAIFDFVNIGEDIFIDDGKIACKIIDKIDLGIVCEVTLAKENGTLLKEEKGINFPSTNLNIPAITSSDEKNFQDIVAFADIIGLSFAQDANDIKKLQEMLHVSQKEDTAIVPKIETKKALENLPEILEQLLLSKKYALMIARGDLAIEVGFENLPYIQEEILNICEAAHVPVIYATQILEGKMKTNLATRSEVTDAALAQRADCIMLNKGPYVLDTLIVLKHILRQVHTQFQKNRQLLNVCKAWKVTK